MNNNKIRTHGFLSTPIVAQNSKFPSRSDLFRMATFSTSSAWPALSRRTASGIFSLSALREGGFAPEERRHLVGTTREAALRPSASSASSSARVALSAGVTLGLWRWSLRRGLVSKRKRLKSMLRRAGAQYSDEFVGEEVDQDLADSLYQRTLEALDLDFVLERLQGLCYTARAAEMALDPESLLAKSPEEARALYETVVELTQLEDADLDLEAKLDIGKQAGGNLFQKRPPKTRPSIGSDTKNIRMDVHFLELKTNSCDASCMNHTVQGSRVWSHEQSTRYDSWVKWFELLRFTFFSPKSISWLLVDLWLAVGFWFCECKK